MNLTTNDGYDSSLTFSDKELRTIHKKFNALHYKAQFYKGKFEAMWNELHRNHSLWEAYCEKYEFDTTVTFDVWIDEDVDDEAMEIKPICKAFKK